MRTLLALLASAAAFAPPARPITTTTRLHERPKIADDITQLIGGGRGPLLANSVFVAVH